MANKDVAALVREVKRTPGYEIKLNGSDHYQATGPDGAVCTFAATPSDPNWEVKARHQLKQQVGWDADIAARIRERERLGVLASVREEEAASLADAQSKADQRVMALEEIRRAGERAEPEAQRQNRQRILDEIAKSEARAARAREMQEVREAARQGLQEANVGATPLAGGLLQGYPTVDRYVTVAELRQALELNRTHGCNTRPLYPRWVAKWDRIMRRAAWHLSPEGIVFDEHGCMVDGVHRGSAAVNFAEEYPALMAGLYPHGIPFRVVTGFPSSLVAILNGGKSRSVKDVLGVAGKSKNAFPIAAALRLCMGYDDGAPWTQWSKLSLDNDEWDAAVAGPYAGLDDHSGIVSRLRHKAKMAPAPAFALAFLLDRDAHDPDHVEEFYQGVCHEADYSKGDPRGVLGNTLMRGVMTTNPAGKKAPGAFQLCLALKAYYRWSADWLPSGKGVQSLVFGPDEKAYAVWRPGMRLIDGEVRIPYRNTL